MEDGLVKCEDCGGTGEYDTHHDIIDVSTGLVMFQTKMCLRCHGKGRLNWIDNVVGKHTTLLQLRLLAHPTTEVKGHKHETWENKM